MKKLAIILILFLLTANHFAQENDTIPDNLGKEFWLCFNPIGIIPGAEFAENPYLFFNIATTQNTLVRIRYFEVDTMISIAANRVEKIELPDSLILDSTDQVSNVNKTVHVEADQDIAVYAFSAKGNYRLEAYNALPVDSWGDEYYSMNYAARNAVIESTTPKRNQTNFAIISNSDGNRISITPTATTIEGWQAGIERPPFVLDQGEVHVVSSLEGLIGSKITGTAPVALISGNDLATVPFPGATKNNENGSHNFLVEQIPPLNSWGTYFITIPLKWKPDQSYYKDSYRILASQDSTSIKINNDSVAWIHAGEFLEISKELPYNENLFEQNGTALLYNTENPMVIKSNKPVLITQFSNFYKGETHFDDLRPNPLMMNIPSVEQFLYQYTFSAYEDE